MRAVELEGGAAARDEANWSGASTYFRAAQEIVYGRLARSRALPDAAKRDWERRFAAAFAAVQRAFGAGAGGTYAMKNAMLTVCHYARPGRGAMPLEDVEANALHLAALLERGVAIPHPGEHPRAVDESRRRGLAAPPE